MAPVNFLVQPQDLDEINNKLDVVIALLERWDKERQETNKVTLPIRTTQDPSVELEIDTVTPVKPTQKRKKRPYVTSDEDGPVKQQQPTKIKRGAAPSPKKTIQLSEEEEDTPQTDNEDPPKTKIITKSMLRSFASNVAKKEAKSRTVGPQAGTSRANDVGEPQKIKLSFAQKSDPPEEQENEDDDFVIEKM